MLDKHLRICQLFVRSGRFHRQVFVARKSFGMCIPLPNICHACAIDTLSGSIMSRCVSVPNICRSTDTSQCVGETFAMNVLFGQCFSIFRVWRERNQCLACVQCKLLLYSCQFRYCYQRRAINQRFLDYLRSHHGIRSVDNGAGATVLSII